MSQIEESKKKKRIPRRIKLLIAAALFLLLLVVIPLCFIGAMLFDPPQTFKPPAVTDDIMFRNSQILTKVAAKTYKSKPGQVAEITLTPDDVNALLVAAQNSDDYANVFLGKKSSPGKIKYKAHYDKGVFHVTLVKNTKIKTPFGSYVKVKVAATPEVTKNKEIIKIHSATVGKFSLSPDKVEKRAEQELEKRKDNKYFKRAREIIISAKVNEDHSITITYYPNKLGRQVLGKVMMNVLK